MTLRPCLTYASASGKSGPWANSRYASSKTTMVRSGTRAMKCSTSSAVTIVAGGVVGVPLEKALGLGADARAQPARVRREERRDAHPPEPPPPRPRLRVTPDELRDAAHPP